ncbi:MAG: hypothetical protein H0T50_04400 [Gemmatimonadales bacterium]|nr:hypothetical protein [Gemmatimonadales bacterium]
MIRDLVRRLYHQSPVVRELEAIEKQLAPAAAPARILQEEFVARLLEQDRYTQSKRLNRHEHQVFSQNGEDGVIREIYRRIGPGSREFLEMGVGNGQVNNTTFLLAQGWRGHWIEGDLRSVESIRRDFTEPLTSARLKLIHAMVTAEAVPAYLRQLGVSRDLDLLSLDLDRNTYWILEALLQVLRPRVAVVEYNATYPPDLEWKVEYDPRAWWNRTSYYGASLKAYELLCRAHGLCLVGCDLHGVNAFFVREELCGDRFEQPFTAEAHYEPGRHYLIGAPAHPPCFSDRVTAAPLPPAEPGAAPRSPEA